jgi:hypothetical protein
LTILDFDLNIDAMQLIKEIASLFRSPKILMTGKWIGFYRLGDAYPKPRRNTDVSFTMDIVNDGNEFRGVVTEGEN